MGDKATPPPTKSKQERIRDNQRRSRARRQEYLADLERRLGECQVTCRDADLQRAALLEVQIENARLRELLSLAGVNEEFVLQYVSQAMSQTGQIPRDTNSSLRQLKPKLGSIEQPRPFMNTAQPLIDRKTSIQPLSTSLPSAPSTAQISHAVVGPSPTGYLSTSPYDVTDIPELSSPTTFDWLYQRPPVPLSTNDIGVFDCSALGLTGRGDARVADDSTVLCSVAKQMISQYHISPQEMEQVRTKLFPGLCKPAYPGAGCAVDNQTLFQVLNELSTRYT